MNKLNVLIQFQMDTMLMILNIIQLINAIMIA